MADPGYNEITIRVLGEDVSATETFTRIAAKGTELQRTGIKIPVVASDPITDAWRAQVNAEIKAAARESLNVPVTADTEEFRGQVAETLASLKDIAREQIPLEATDADTFRATVLAAVAETRAEIGSILVPVEADTSRMAASEVPELSSAGEAPQQGLTSLRPSYTPAPLFGGGEDPYAAAREAAQSEPPIELPVRAANPINTAFVAQVNSAIRGMAADALDIPAVPELESFQTQVAEFLLEMSDVAKLDIPLEAGDAAAFRQQVGAIISQVDESMRAVIDVEVNDDGLTDLQSKTVAASQAELELVAAEQKLNQAMASGDEEAVAKARQDVAAATQEADAATVALEESQAAAGVEVRGLAEATDVAGFSMRGLMAAMGPLWMIMNVLQIAMFAFGSSSSSTASQVQDTSQSVIGLGDAAGKTAQQLVGGNQSLQGMAGDLLILGSSSTQFAQAYSGSMSTAQRYTDNLASEQKALGATFVTAAQAADSPGWANAGATIAQVTEAANRSKSAYDALDPTLRTQVDRYNALHDIVPQAKDALAGMQAAAQAEQATLLSLNYTMSDGQKAFEDYGIGVQTAAKALSDAEAGSTYLEDSTDKASITAGQAVQHWQQLQAAVTSAGQAEAQAAQGVASAEHGVETAREGVASAVHAEGQAVLATQQAQQAYTNTVYQETQAQQAVTAARAAAQQQLISLQLQANDAATSVENANLSLFQAQQNAGKYGVNTGNAQQIADTQNITAANAAQVQAAIQLVQAENALADAQNSSGNAQSSLNTARQQGVDNNPQVLSAEHSLSQAQDAVAQAAQGVTNAQYAQQQSALQVTNAEWGLQQASQAVTQAKNAEYAAEVAYTTAQANATTSTDANTLAGAQNRQMLEQIFQAYQNATGSEQIAASMTQTVGEKMGFTSGQIGDVISSLVGLNGTSAQFSIEGTPSINPARLIEVGNEFHLDFAPMAAKGGRAYAAGGATAGGMALVGEHGPELVRLAPGSQVIPASNTAGMLRGFASGGAVGSLDNPMAALAANMPLTAAWGAYDAIGQTAHVLGGPAINLPAAGPVDLGPFSPGSYGGGGGAAGGGSLAASGALAAQAQAYAQSRLAAHGWGPDQMAPLVKLWNQESGWNPYAVNPSSGAYGIPQSLGHGHPYNLGDFVGQVDWGEDYVAGRYGSPDNAWAHERAFNWYAAGGPTGGGLAVVGEHGPELVSSGGGSVATAQRVEVDLHVDVAPGADSAVAVMVKNLVRAGQIRFVVANGQVVVS